jgi:hypothetical protein
LETIRVSIAVILVDIAAATFICGCGFRCCVKRSSRASCACLPSPLTRRCKPPHALSAPCHSANINGT